MKVLLMVFVAIVVAGAAILFYLKYRVDNIRDGHDLLASIDLEVDKFTKSGSPKSLMIGVYKEGESFFKGYGSIAPDESSVFQIASISKLFTASLLKILSDEKVITMQSTLGELIGQQYTLSSDAKVVTLQQLATHTSGFPKVPKSLIDISTRIAGKGHELDNPYSHVEFSDVINYLGTTEGKRKPGHFEYSNFGMGLLGHVLEIVTGKDLDSLAYDKIFSPLGMVSTSTQLTVEMNKMLVQGYTATGEVAELWTFGALAGAGAFSSNAFDMMRFVKANIEDEHLITNTLKTMQQPLPGSDVAIAWVQPGYIEKFFGNKTIVWHNGMVGGYASYIAVDQHTKTGVVILCAKAVDVTMLGIMLMRQVRTQSWAK